MREGRRGGMTIPEQVFDDLDGDGWWEDLATCACVHSMEYVLPTAVSRAVLEMHRARGHLLRIELREYSRSRPQWVRQILSEDEIRAIARFPGSLHVYASAGTAAEGVSLSERLRPMLIDLAVMLSIYDSAIFRNAQRARWVFRAAIRALQSGLPCDATRSNPIGERAMSLPSPESIQYARGASAGQGDMDFGAFAVSTSTQLRALYHLALKVAEQGPWDSARVLASTSDERRSLVRRLGMVLVEGLEVPAERRGALMTGLIGDLDFAPGRPDASLVDGIDDLWQWLKGRMAAGRTEREVSPYTAAARQLLLAAPPDRYPSRRITSMVKSLRLPRQTALDLEMERLNLHLPGLPPPAMI